MYANDLHSMTVRKDAEFWCRKGSEHMHRGDYENSMMYFDKAITIYPNLVTTWENKARCLDEQEQYLQAIDCYNRAIQVDPENSDLWYNKSISCMKLGQLEEAEICAKTALDLALGR